MSTIEQVIGSGPFQASWDSLQQYSIPTWYEDAKFGIFIHWGPYAVPAFGNEWYARHMYVEGTSEYEHHLKTYGPHSQFGYKDFIPKLSGENFDAAQWADLFKKSGAKFVVPVAEHHDGFAMFDCPFTEWNSVKMGPKRDVTGELAKACRALDMIFGVSYHRAENWWFFDGGLKYDSDVQDPRYQSLYNAHPGPADEKERHDFQFKPAPSQAFLKDDWLLRLCDLVDRYEPQLVWFDWWINHEAFKPYLQEFAAYYYNRGAQWDKGVAINYKYGAYEEGTAVFDVERGQLSGIRPQFWQTDTSVSKSSWGYTENQDYKTTESIIGDLVDIVSKNGALLLNVGPRPDGTIPEPEQKMLLEIGQWLKVNGESIYGTRPWNIFGEGPTEISEGAFTDTNRAAFTGEDIRFTAKGDTLYATMLAWPGSQCSIKSLGASSELSGKVSEVQLLGHDAPLEFSQDGDALSVKLPETKPCEHAFVLKIRQ